MKIKNHNNGVKKTYIEENKEEIVASFYETNQKQTNQKGPFREQDYDSLFWATIITAAVGVGLSMANIPAAIIFFIMSLVSGGIVTTMAADRMIKIARDHILAKKSYSEVLNTSGDIADNLHREVRPVLSSYSVTKSVKNARKHDTISSTIPADKAESVKDADLIHFILADGKTLVTYTDEFMNMALDIDALIFETQYEDYEADLIELHYLMKDYVVAREKFDKKTPDMEEKIRNLYVSLGYIYAKVQQKVQQYKQLNDGPRRTLKNDEE